MTPLMQPGEEVVMAFPVTFRPRYPIEMTPQMRVAYLTSRRLLIEEGGDYLSIPFEWMLGLDLIDKGGSKKYIEMEHERKIRFSVMSKELSGIHDENTERLYIWLRQLFLGEKPASRVIEEIKKGKTDF